MGAEAKLEAKCVKYAKSLGFVMPKWASPGTNGVHDRLLIVIGKMIPIEFKAPGGQLSALQRNFHRKLDRLEVEQYTIYDYENFVEICEQYR